MKNAFYLDTVQHTGTWFMIGFLEAHPDVDGFLIQRDFKKDDDTRMKLSTALKKKDLKKSDTIFIHSHLDGNGDLATEFLYDVGAAKEDVDRKVIIPVRDPALSLFTRELRHPELEHDYLIHGFCTLAALIDDPNFYFIPVDLELSASKRRQLLEGALKHVGLKKAAYVKEWAADWPIIHSAKKDSRMKHMYQSGRVKQALRYVKRESNLMKGNEYVIRPFLEKLGYTNLPWWS